ncbi:T9SS type A sorting domain-containing protein [Marinilabilia rubra]|uniref:Secretion system C-terminal sorting domain-containing protein n=1 Tax=Marinilabilia rubra TaxID=2162893 RepID=A0A2U2B542_9BACT|nr:T9SS type A sorting domain-containing protein [Marinilabilia rubra]PWD98176.1 hypothetical protein DDZ16_16930 [Marinilabilia rubra]
MGPLYKHLRHKAGHRIFTPALLFFWIFIFSGNIQADAAKDKDCVNCFSTSVETVETEGECITYEILVEAGDSCKHALSHFTVTVLCGNISDASNSRNWKMEYPVTDPTTGLTGLKVDDIQEFGENGQESFTLTYTVCADNEECLNELTSQSFEVAYKAATCVFFEEIEPPVRYVPLEASLEPTHITCTNSQSGAIQTTVSGGVSPYSFEWSNGANTQNLSNLEAGLYSLTVTDAADSSIVLSTEITAPASITPRAAITPAACGQNTGAIDLTVSGGSGEYNFQWDNGSTEEDLENLGTGMYTVVISDSAGCTREATFYVSEESPISISETHNKLKCYEDSTGTIEIEATGGTEPYSFKWSSGDTTQNLSGLNAGLYTVIVTDSLGCTKTKNINLSKELFYASIATTDAGCSGKGGSASITLRNGTEPYSIEWSTGDSTLTVEDLEAGYYTVRIIDVNGCEIYQAVNINQSEAPKISVSSSWTGCSPDDSIRVDLSANGGAAPHEWIVNGENSSSTFYLDDAANLEVTVIDATGCTSTQNTEITPKTGGPEVQINLTDASCNNPLGSASLSINGESPFSVHWNGESGELSTDSLTAGTYTVQVTDADGCETSKSFTVSNIEKPTAEIISPDMMPDCSSSDNILEGITTNATTIGWELISSDSNWVLTSNGSQTATYNAGTGSATAILSAESTDGCFASDTIDLNCIDNSTPTDSIDDGDSNGGNNGGGSNDDPTYKDCSAGCYEITSETITSTGADCYHYEFTIKSDGTCFYDLSHLVIELEEGVAANVENSLGYPMEINFTDPQSEMFGIKIDEISGLEESRDSLVVTFDLCGTESAVTDFRFGFKAGRCLDIIKIETPKVSDLKTATETGNIDLMVYPNPATSFVTFDFAVSKSMSVTIELYDSAGNKVDQVFNQAAEKNIDYKISSSLNKSADRMFFYRIKAGNRILEGKIMKID